MTRVMKDFRFRSPWFFKVPACASYCGVTIKQRLIKGVSDFFNACAEGWDNRTMPSLTDIRFSASTKPDLSPCADFKDCANKPSSLVAVIAQACKSATRRRAPRRPNCPPTPAGDPLILDI
jgi:hypothetical protein